MARCSICLIGHPAGRQRGQLPRGAFDRAYGARIYTLNLPGELAAHDGAVSDLSRLCALAAGGRLDGQVEPDCSWREAGSAIGALLNRRIGGKVVLHMD